MAHSAEKRSNPAIRRNNVPESYGDSQYQTQGQPPGRVLRAIRRRSGTDRRALPRVPPAEADGAGAKGGVQSGRGEFHRNPTLSTMSSYADLAERFLDVGHREAALDVCSSGYTTNPHDERGVLVYLRVLRDLGAIETARQVYRQARALHPNSAALHVAWARLLADQGAPATGRVVTETLRADTTKEIGIGISQPEQHAYGGDHLVDSSAGGASRAICPPVPESEPLVASLADLQPDIGAAPTTPVFGLPATAGTAPTSGVPSVSALLQPADSRARLFLTALAAIIVLLGAIALAIFAGREAGLSHRIDQALTAARPDRLVEYNRSIGRLQQIAGHSNRPEAFGALALAEAIRLERTGHGRWNLTLEHINKGSSSRHARLARQVLALKGGQLARPQGPWYERWIVLRRAIKEHDRPRLTTLLEAEVRRPAPSPAVLIDGIAYLRWNGVWGPAKRLLEAAISTQPNHPELRLEAALLSATRGSTKIVLSARDFSQGDARLGRFRCKLALLRGYAYLQRQRVSEALAEAQKAAIAYPQLAHQAHTLAALAYLGPGGDVLNALTALSRLRQGPGLGNPAVESWYALALNLAGRAKEATQVVEAMNSKKLGVDLDGMQVLIRLRIATAIGSTKQDLKYCEHVAQSTKPVSLALQQSAALCIGQRVVAESTAAYQRLDAMIVDPGLRDYVDGLRDTQQDRLLEARRRLELAGKRRSVRPLQPDLALARVSDRLDDQKHRLAMLRRAVLRSAGSAESRLAFATALTDEGQRKAGLAQLEKLQSLGSTNPRLACGTAIQLLRLGKYEAGAQALARTGATPRQSVGFRVCRARVELALGKRRRAAATLDGVLAEEPENLEALLVRTRLRLWESKTSLARRDFGRARSALRRQQPSSAQLLEAAGLAASLDDHRMAFELAKQALRQDRRRHQLGKLTRHLMRVAKMLLGSPRTWARNKGVRYLHEAKRHRRRTHAGGSTGAV